MTVAANKGVEYLIGVAKSATNGGSLQARAIKALGEAGGPAAQAYLISVAKSATNGGDLQAAAIEALGRASRE